MSSPLGGGRPPISIGIQPQIALFGVLLGGVCAIAAYTEKYQRNQEEIDELLKTKYSANIRDQQAKMPQITRTIRGGDDFRVDSAMNKLVWGGKAGLTKPATSGTGTGTGGAAGSASSSSSSDDDSSSSDEEWDSSSSSSSSSADEEEDGMDDSQLSKKERRRKRKERKRKRAERRKQREVEKQRFEAERNKLMVQSVAAGAAVGAVAVAASIFLGSSRR